MLALGIHGKGAWQGTANKRGGGPNLKPGAKSDAFTNPAGFS